MYVLNAGSRKEICPDHFPILTPGHTWRGLFSPKPSTVGGIWYENGENGGSGNDSHSRGHVLGFPQRNHVGCRKIGYGLLRMRFLGYDPTVVKPKVLTSERELTEQVSLEKRYREGLQPPDAVKRTGGLAEQ
jgi:hypothetical protein